MNTYTLTLTMLLGLFTVPAYALWRVAAHRLFHRPLPIAVQMHPAQVPCTHVPRIHFAPRRYLSAPVNTVSASTAPLEVDINEQELDRYVTRKWYIPQSLKDHPTLRDHAELDLFEQHYFETIDQRRAEFAKTIQRKNEEFQQEEGKRYQNFLKARSAYVEKIKENNGGRFYGSDKTRGLMAAFWVCGAAGVTVMLGYAIQMAMKSAWWTSIHPQSVDPKFLIRYARLSDNFK